MKSYGQYCGVARGLDLVGDRWSLLIIRELALGDRRYGELQRGLPGIATNLLAERLRDLTAIEVIDRRTAADGTTRYGLAERGRELLPTLFALVRWATPAMVPGPEPTDHEDPSWVAFAASAYLREAPAAASVRVVLACGDGRIQVTARHAVVTIGLGAEASDDASADVRVVATSWALMALVSGSLPLDDLSRLDPDAAVTGTREARRSLQQLVAHNRA